MKSADRRKILKIILSLSLFLSLGGGFGPVVADGYGIGYGVRDDVMGFNISTYR